MLVHRLNKGELTNDDSVTLKYDLPDESISNVWAPREHARKIKRIQKSLKQKSWSSKIPGAEVSAALRGPQGQGPAKRESAVEIIGRMGEKGSLADTESVGQLLRNGTENAPHQKRCCIRR